MHTENALLIEAPLNSVYALAADVGRWAEILPHYRWVRVLQDDGDRRLVEMAAWRDLIPVWWCAEQRLYPDEPRITFRHLRGITAGMEVAWSFAPNGRGVLVAIQHDLRLRWPLVGGFVANQVIGPQFVSNIAGKTLRRIKQLAEGGRGARSVAT